MSERTSWYYCAECDKPSTRDTPIEHYAIAASATGEPVKPRSALQFHPDCIPAANKKLRDGFRWVSE